MRNIAWWKNAFAADRPLWEEAILEADRRQADWKLAVRSWIDARELKHEAGGVAREAPLAGTPFGVKDLFDQKGVVTRAGSILFEEIGTPAGRDALILRRLREQGALPVGRTNMNEFAYGLDGFNPHTGDCPHPEEPDRISGGSSSGSAWVVAKGILPVALGTDTGGSVRVPAALCGIYGFRGIPDETASVGVFPLAKSFDTAGWFTSSGEDMLELLRLLWKPEHPPADSDREQNGEGGSLLWYAPRTVRLSQECREAYRRFLEEHPVIESASSLADSVSAKLDALSEDAFWAYNVIGSCEAFEVHRGWFSTYRDRYNPDVWRLIDRSRHWEPGALEYARRLEEQVTAVMADLLGEEEALLMPAVHTVAPRKREVDQEFRVDIIRLTSLASLAGVPVLTVPLRTASGLSCGVQIICRPGRVLSVAERFLSRGAR